MNKLTERDLIIPVLDLLRQKGGFATIREVRDYIIANYPLSELDLKMSATRKNEHIFEQQIRNLTSHGTLEKYGLASSVDGGFRLMPGIAEMLNDNTDWVYELISNNRTSKAVKNVVDRIDKNRKVVSFEEELTGEGIVTTAKDVKRRTRSSKLRKAAIEHYAVDGHIKCHCCDMDFDVSYGPEYADSCIEIHHRKPIYMYEDEDINLTIADALKNVIPVCPNCHRVIHRQKLFSDDGNRKLKQVIARNKAKNA